jgi:hypothetical protein
MDYDFSSTNSMDLVDRRQSEFSSDSAVSRVLRLTLLSPKIVEMILDGRQPLSLTMKELLIGFPLEWGLQKSKLIKL